MIQLKKLELHKYLSFLDSKLELDNRGIVMVTGENNLAEGFQSNGSGKSTLLSGIPFALYGKTLNGLKADDVINRNFKKDCYVKLTLKDTESGTEYRVERYRKDTTNKNRVLLFADDRDITEATTAKTEAHIESIIGIDYITYVTGIHVGKTDGVPLFADASDGEKKKILENIANIQIYEKAHDVALDRLKSTQTELEITKSAQQMGLQSIANFNSRQQQAVTQKEQVTNEIATLEAQLKQLEDTHKVNKVSYEDTINKEVVLQASYKEQLDGFKSQQEAVQLANNMVNAVSQAKATLETTIRYNKSNLDKLRESYKVQQTSQVCPVCGAPLNEEHRQQELDTLAKQGKEQASQLKVDEQQLTKLTEDFNKYTVIYQQSSAKISDVSTLTNQYNTSINNINSLNNKLNQEENMINQVKNNLNNTKSKLDTFTDWQAEIDKQTKVNEETNKTLVGLEDKVEVLTKVAKKVFSNTGVRAYVLQSITPYLNQQANTYLSALTGNTMRMELNTQTETKTGELKDKFSIELFDNYDKKLPYKGASTGERKRVDLSISFAIRDLIISRGQSAFNLAIYDECFDGLDAVGMEHVLELLNKEQADVSSIFVISHNDNLKSMFSNSLIVSKDTDGNSKVNE